MGKKPKYIKVNKDIDDLEGIILKILYFVLIEVFQNAVQ